MAKLKFGDTSACPAMYPVQEGGGSSGKYQLLDRIKDDNNNEIGTVSGFFTDVNDVEYAVVCLDAQYRLASGNWMSTGNELVTNMPSYQNLTVWDSKETSTVNTQYILDHCTLKSYNSESCEHCRNKSFTIDNSTYYGQLPNIIELIDIFNNRTNINTVDTSAGSYSSLVLPSTTSCWSSTQGSKWGAWGINNMGYATAQAGQINQMFVIPVLEIPNN